MKKIFVLVSIVLISVQLVISQTSQLNSLPFQHNFCVQSTDNNFQGDWKIIGPLQSTNHGMGRVEAIWVDPNSADYILAGSNSGGLFETTDGGGHWIPKTNDIPGIGINSIDVGYPDDVKTIILGTGTNIMARPWWETFGYGIIFSSDNGNTWQADQQLIALSGNPKLQIEKAKYIPNTNGGIIAVGQDFVAVKANALANWTNTTPSGLNGTLLNDIEFTPGFPNRIWIAGENGSFGYGGKLFYTDDGGNTWIDKTSLLVSDDEIIHDPDFTSVSQPISNITALPTDYLWHTTQVGNTPDVWHNNSSTNNAEIFPAPNQSGLLCQRVFTGSPDFFTPNYEYKMKITLTMTPGTMLSAFLSSGTGLPGANPANDQLIWSHNTTSIGGTLSFDIDFNVNVGFYPNLIYFLADNISANPTGNERIEIDKISLIPVTPSIVNVSVPNGDDVFIYYNNLLYNHNNIGQYIEHLIYNTNNDDFDLISDFHTTGPVTHEFEVSPDDINTMYGGGGGGGYSLCRSLDGGHHFYQQTFTHFDIREIVLVKNLLTGLTDIVYEGSDGGIAKFNTGTSNSFSVSKLNGTGLAITQFYGFSGIESRPDILFGGAQDNGIRLIKQFSQPLIGGDGYNTESYEMGNDVGKLFYSTGGGYSDPSIESRTFNLNSILNTNSISNHLTIIPNEWEKPYGGYFYNHPFLKHPSGTLFVGGDDDLHFSVNHADPSGSSDYQRAHLRDATKNGGKSASIAMDVDPEDDNWVYVAFNGTYDDNNNPLNRLFVDKGDIKTLAANWWDITSGLPADLEITDVCINPDNHYEVWVSFKGYEWGNNFNHPQRRVYMSTDAGNTWHSVSEGLPNFTVECLVYRRGADGDVYAGTDAGIFHWIHEGENAWDGHWECFSQGLPACIITEMEINYCSNQLRAATWGRGIWETSLAPLQTTTTVLTDITTNTTWNASTEIVKNTTIESGATLTITNCTLDMAKDIYIKVKPGAKLVIDNATLTNVCGVMWSGIQVLGNPSLEQDYDEATTMSTNQGLLVMNNATLENATLAVLMDEANYTAPDFAYPNGSGNFGGGIVWMENSTVTNCRDGIAFSPYHGDVVNTSLQQYTPNLSYIQLSTFENTGFLNEPYQNTFTKDFISMNDIDGVRILGNTFNAFTTSSTVQQTKAVVSYNAAFRLSHYCPSNGNPCTTIPNTINNCRYGVFSTAIAPYFVFNPYVVDDNVFVNTKRAVFTSGFDYGVITRNNISLSTDMSDTTYGIYTLGCSHYTIQENNINLPDHDGQKNPLSYGIIINCSGRENNLVYKNTVNNTNYGIMAYGENADLMNSQFPVPKEYKGLAIRCNAFSNVKISILAISNPNDPPHTGLLARNQGYCNGLYSSPAANSFSNSVLDLFSDIAYSTPIDYWIETSSPTPSNSPSADWNFVNQCTTTSEGCPSMLKDFDKEPSDFSSRIQQINENEQNKNALLHLIDDGNTDYLLSLINNPNISSTQLKNLLIAAGPYLSDSILNSTIKRYNAMANADLKLVILNNSPLTDDVYAQLQSAYPDVASNYLVMQMQQLDISDLGVLLSEVDHTASNTDEIKNDLLNTFIYQSKTDSALNTLQMLNDSIAAYWFAKAMNDSVTSENLLNGFSENDSSLMKLKTYCNLLSQAKSNPSDTTLNNEIASLQNEHTLTGILSSNFTYNKTKTWYEEEIPTIDETGERLTSNTNTISNQFNVLPNPAKDEVTFSFPDDGSGVIQIYNTEGKLINDLLVLQHQTNLHFNVSQMESGVYYCSLIQNNHPSQMVKLVVMH